MNSYNNGISNGYLMGYETGREEGESEGFNKGLAEGKAIERTRMESELMHAPTFAKECEIHKDLLKKKNSFVIEEEKDKLRVEIDKCQRHLFFKQSCIDKRIEATQAYLQTHLRFPLDRPSTAETDEAILKKLARNKAKKEFTQHVKEDVESLKPKKSGWF